MKVNHTNPFPQIHLRDHEESYGNIKRTYRKPGLLTWYYETPLSIKE